MKTTWRQEFIALVILAAMFAAAAWSWSRVPDRIPVHWNAAGEVDGYGGKFAGLLLTPLIAVGVYSLFFIMPKLDPGNRNYESFGKAYWALRMALMAYFAVLYGAMLASIFGSPLNMTTVVLLAVGVLFVTIGNVMSKIRPNFFVGIRTPWTLSSRESWDKTHRLGGWLFIAEGVLFMALAFAHPALVVPGIIGSVVAMFCILLPYSYRVYARDPERVSPAGVSPANEEAPSAPDRPASGA